MSRFTEGTWEANGETVRGRPIVCLTSPLVYEVQFLGSGWLVAAGTGFTTDLGSVPPIPCWLRRFLARSVRRRCLLRRLIRQRRRLRDQIAKSSVVHDLLRGDIRWSKWVGDLVFLEAMGVDGVPLHKRLLCLAAVLLNFNRG